jgi:uncharacterized membrane protein HdeD (DUF308 family)
MASQSAGLATTFTAIRGVIMIIAGLFTLAYPIEALRLLVFVGGGILIADGVLNLASLRFSGPRDLTFWLGVARSVLAVVAGLIVLLSPWLTSMAPLSILRVIVGVLAICVGMIEICGLLLPKPKSMSHVWPMLISGAAYALFGLALIVLPVEGAVVLARIVAILMIAFAGSLLVRAWHQRSTV